MIKSILKDTSKDVLRYVPAKVIPGIMGFIGLLFFTHVFSAEDYGNYYVVFTSITVLHLVGSSWASNSVMRFYSEYKLKDHLSYLYSNLIFSFLIVNAIITILYLTGLVIFRSQIPKELAPFLQVSIFCYLSGSAYLLLLYSLRADLQASAFSLFEIISSVGKLGIALAFVFFLKKGAISLLWGMLLVNVVLVVLISKRLSILSKIKKDMFSSETSLDLFKYGAPLALSGLSAWLLILSDRYLLQYFGTAKEVGIYSVSFSVIDGGFVLLYSILMLAAYPVIILTWEEKGREITQQLIRELTRYYFILCVPATVGITVLGKDVFSLFVGKDFVEGYKLVPLFAFCSLIQGLFQYVAKSLEIYKKTLILALIFLISGIANILLNILFIPAYGYLGSGIAKVISNVLLIILGITISHSFMPWLAPLKSLFKVAGSAVLMGVVLVFLKGFLSVSLMNLILLIALGAGMYLVLLFLSNEIKKGEIDFLKSYYYKLIKVTPH